MKTVNKYLLWSGVVWTVAALGAGYAADTREIPQPQSTAQRRAVSFRATDLNGDGFVSREEFAEANHLSSSAPTSDRDIRANRILGAFQDMDENADGRVSGKEYVRFMEKSGS